LFSFILERLLVVDEFTTDLPGVDVGIVNRKDGTFLSLLESFCPSVGDLSLVFSFFSGD
jgi:hypothetical protein